MTVRVLDGLRPILEEEQPDWVLVQGDTTTTMAGALGAFHHGIRVGHVEAGLRTFNKHDPWPEEMNRRVAGVLADVHFAPTPSSAQNLYREGVPEDRVYVTGNTVIDALQTVAEMPFDPAQTPLAELGLNGQRLIVATMHRREMSAGGARRRVRGPAGGRRGPPRGADRHSRAPEPEGARADPRRARRRRQHRPARPARLPADGLARRAQPLRDHRLRRPPGGGDRARQAGAGHPRHDGAARERRGRATPCWSAPTGRRSRAGRPRCSPTTRPTRRWRARRTPTGTATPRRRSPTSSSPARSVPNAEPPRAAGPAGRRASTPRSSAGAPTASRAGSRRVPARARAAPSPPGSSWRAARRPTTTPRSPATRSRTSLRGPSSPTDEIAVGRRAADWLVGRVQQRRLAARDGWDGDAVYLFDLGMISAGLQSFGRRVRGRSATSTPASSSSTSSTASCARRSRSRLGVRPAVGADELVDARHRPPGQARAGVSCSPGARSRRGG